MTDIIYTTVSNIPPGPVLRMSMVGGDMNNILNNKFILSTSENGSTFKLHILDCTIETIDNMKLNLNSLDYDLRIELDKGIPKDFNFDMN
jgi:hypothetical protein